MSSSPRILALLALVVLPIASADGGQSPSEAADPVTARRAPVVGESARPAAPPAPATGARHVATGRPAAPHGDTWHRPDGPPHTADIRFCFDCAGITAAGARRLRTFARSLARGTPLRVEGHADAVGGDRYNDRLSRRRAEAAAAILQDFPLRVSTRWFGESQAHGGRAALDRRVVLRAG